MPHVFGTVARIAGKLILEDQSTVVLEHSKQPLLICSMT
jgi:hypothetical protein